LALPVKWPAVIRLLELSPTIQAKGAAEHISEAISYDMALSLSHSVGGEISLLKLDCQINIQIYPLFQSFFHNMLDIIFLEE
jgi:hypothetical protein